MSLAMELLQTLKRVVTKQYIIILILASMLFASNAAWLYAWMQYDYAVYDEYFQLEQIMARAYQRIRIYKGTRMRTKKDVKAKGVKVLKRGRKERLPKLNDESGEGGE